MINLHSPVHIVMLFKFLSKHAQNKASYCNN